VKRRIALGFLAFLFAAIGGALWLASTPWAGRKLCELATTKVRDAAGVEISIGACRVRPLRLAIELDEVRVGPPARPIFAADAVSVQIAPLQALSKTLALDEVSVVRPRVNLVLPPSKPGEKPAPCPPPLLQQFHLRRLQVEDGTASITLPGGEEILVGRVDVHTRSEWIPTDMESLLTGARRSRVTVPPAGAQMSQMPQRAPESSWSPKCLTSWSIRQDGPFAKRRIRSSWVLRCSRCSS